MKAGIFNPLLHGDAMAKHFDFLAKARPAALYKLLERLSLEDATIVLTGLPHGLAVQVMAYFPEDRQGDLLPAMREARRIAPERVEQTAERIRGMLKAAKEARTAMPGEAAPAASAPPSPSSSPRPPAAPQSPPPPRPGKAAPPKTPPAMPSRQLHAYQSSPPPAAPDNPANAGSGGKKDTPGKTVSNMLKRWIPRAAGASPINGPPLPGKPPAIEGDPLQSPLARAGLLDLIGRAQDKLLPGKRTPERKAAPPPPARPRGKRPEPPEGVVRAGAIGVGGPPRVLGPAGPKAPAPAADAGGVRSAPRRMDGKAILAAILREVGPEVRGQVKDDDPALFRELQGRMFFFDDLIYTEDGALARVFTAAPAEDSALALKFAAPALRDRVFRVVSPGRAKALRDAPSGRAGVDAIERAQKKVLAVALQLQAAGRILIDPRDPDLAGGG